MLFTWDILVPKSTTEGEPVTQILPLAQGIITWVYVLFPPGCAKLAHCRIFHFAKAIFPSVEDMDLSGDTFPITWDEYYEMYQTPYELKVKAWNEDDTFPHTITVAVAVLPRKAIVAPSIVDAIKGVFGLVISKIISPGGKEIEMEE